jgi:uncharacterized iron-regulated membrane protein
MTSLRSLWLRLHRWFALGLGWILILAGLTGTLLIIGQPLDRMAHPELFQARTTHAQQAAALTPILARAHEEFGSKATLRFRLPQETQDSLWLRVQAANWRGTIYLDPVTGQEQGRRGETEGFVNTLFKLHSTLLLDANGKAILAWTTLAYVLLLLTGVILWWPKRWPGNWRIELNKSLVRALFDMHRIGGVIMGLLIAVSVVTGAYMAWRPLGDWLNVLSSSTAVKPPKLPALAEEGTAQRCPPMWTPCWPRPARPCPMPRPASCSCRPMPSRPYASAFAPPASRTPTASARYGWTRATVPCWTSGAGMNSTPALRRWPWPIRCTRASWVAC